MRRGGIPYDQLQKTNMYGDDNRDAVNELEDRYAQHNDGVSPDRAGGGLGVGKRKKKKKNRPKVNIEPSASASMQPDIEAEESMHSNMDDLQSASGHSQNRRFFEEQMARATGDIKASIEVNPMVQ